MKTKPANPEKAAVRSPLSRPPPQVHSASEPEYDTEQLTRRANEVTGVLKQILKERPAANPLPGSAPAQSRSRPS
jgi:hypothetical protein